MDTALYACLREPRHAGSRPTIDSALAVARDFSPRLHRYHNHCVVLDVSGLGRLLGDPQTMGRELSSQLETRIKEHESRIARIGHESRIARIGHESWIADHDQYVSRIAVAPTQIAAMVLSAAYPGLTVVTADVDLALAPVPLAVLQQAIEELQVASGHTPARSASGKKLAPSADEPSATSALQFATLARWGLTMVGELAALPADALSARLGQSGVVLQRLALGIDPGPLVPDPDVPRFLERIELEWPIDGLEPLAFVLARLLEPLSLSLERADRGAAAIHLRLRLVDRTEHVRMLQLPAAMRDPRVLRTLLVLDLESHPPHAAIDIVTIEIDPAPGRVIQYSLLERARPSAETVATLMARLGALVGDSRCGQPALLDSYGPDAFEMRRFAPDESGMFSTRPVGDGAESDLRREGGSYSDTDGGPAASAFRQKTRFESAVLRRFRPPVAVRVTVERGRPRFLFIDRRGMPGGHVEQCAGPWRSSGAWWKESSDVPGGVDRPWNRDEWDVALSDGSVCRVFQARDTERWFLDGVMD